jgi:hypothetical protein
MTAARLAADRVAPLSLLDRVCLALDDARRPLDFALIHHLPDPLPLPALRAGATSALALHPVSGSRIAGAHWVWAGETGDAIVSPSSGSGGLDEDTVRSFIASPFDLQRRPPVAQLAGPDPASGGQILVTRFHHAACDGRSALLWIAHQLAVACGSTAPVQAPRSVEPLALRQHRAPVRRSRFASLGPSRTLAGRGASPRLVRRWLTVSRPSFPHRPSGGGIAEGDALAASFLDALVAWQGERTGKPRLATRLGLWVPVDLRRRRSAGFGNGTSRVRLHATWPAGTPVLQTCAIVRKQLAWSLRHGEWAVPARLPFARLPGALERRLLRLYARRPWVDMGSAAFTHVAHSPLDRAASPHLPTISRQENIGMLDRKHPVALSCLSQEGTTWLTFAYDPAHLDPEEVARLAGLVCARLDQVRAAFERETVAA